MLKHLSTFEYSKDYKHTDFRRHPEQYDIGKGEQGVLLVEPYKSEILPHWRFKTEKLAKKSAKKIFALFQAYKSKGDFVGMDMAKKFLQMGFTRARRYANHPSGRKYTTEKAGRRNIKVVAPQALDWEGNEKARAARIFYREYVKARTDKKYLRLREKYKLECSAKEPLSA